MTCLSWHAAHPLRYDFGNYNVAYRVSYTFVAMFKYIIPIILFLIFFGALYSAHKSGGGKYKRHKQLASAVTGSLLLMFVLYTCNSDNWIKCYWSLSFIFLKYLVLTKNNTKPLSTVINPKIENTLSTQLLILSLPS